MSRARDMAIANEVTQPIPTACGATGCPNRWSVDGGNGRACSAHAWAARHDWPAITQQQQWDDVERHRFVAPKSIPPPLTRLEKSGILQKLRGIAAGMAMRPYGFDKAWAHELKAREERGDSLTFAQRAMWREAVNEAPPLQMPTRIKHPERIAAAAPILEPDFFEADIPAFEENE